MRISCSSLIPFSDGELVGAQREAFERHLRSCDRCRERLVTHMAIDSRLRELGELMRARKLAAQPGLHMGAERALATAPSRWQRFRAWLCKW